MEIDKNALDRYITGNWGEDQSSSEEPVKEVYLQFSEETGTFDLLDAETGEKLNEVETKNYHDLVELATANGWEIVDNPSEVQDYPDDDPGFDPMFLM